MRLMVTAWVVGMWGCASGSAYGPSGDQRLEAAVQDRGEQSDSDQRTLSMAEKRCADAPTRLALARSDEKPEAERLRTYVELYVDLKNRVTVLDEGLQKNPDLKYKEGGQKAVSALEECNQTYADVRNEFERFIRELCDMPVVQEIKGGSKHNVARLDFDIVREAIDTLAPDDRESLYAKMEAAEKKVGASGKSKGGRR